MEQLNLYLDHEEKGLGHFGKIRKSWLPSFSPFPTIFLPYQRQNSPFYSLPDYKLKAFTDDKVNVT